MEANGASRGRSSGRAAPGPARTATMQWTEPADKILVVREPARAGSDADWPHVIPLVGMYYLLIRDTEAASRIPSILEQQGYRVVAESEDASGRCFRCYGESALWDGRRPPGSRRARMQS